MTDDDPEVVWSDRKSHYTNVALVNARDGDHDPWDPATGWSVNRPRVVDVYGYYRDLAIKQPSLFLWAGLGHMAGGAVVAGLDVASIESIQQVLIAIGRDIFYDLAWQHEAYLDGADIVSLAALHDQFQTYPAYASDGTETYVRRNPASSYGDAWRDITSGDPNRVANGNLALLINEQQSVVQPGYDYLKDELAITADRMSAFTNEVHPYHRAFLIDVPQGNILDFDSRWGWITQANYGMFGNWNQAGEDERTRLVSLPFDQILRLDFSPIGRPDLVPPGSQ